MFPICRTPFIMRPEPLVVVDTGVIFPLAQILEQCGRTTGVVGVVMGAPRPYSTPPMDLQGDTRVRHFGRLLRGSERGR